MAEAYKCDRCGDLYEKNEVKTPALVGQPFVFHFVISNGQYNQDPKDLCDTCIRELLRQAMKELGVIKK